MIYFRKKIIILFVAVLLCQTAFSQSITDISDVNFQFSHVIEKLRFRFSNSDSKFQNLLGQLNKQQEFIRKNVSNESTEFINSMEPDLLILMKAYNAPVDSDSYRFMSDVEEDLSIKLAPTDSSLRLSPLTFKPVSFFIKIATVANKKYMVRANCWPYRDFDARENFSDQIPDPLLKVSVVRGMYAFWLEPVDGSIPKTRKYMKIEVNTSTTNTTITLRPN